MLAKDSKAIDLCKLMFPKCYFCRLVEISTCKNSSLLVNLSFLLDSLYEKKNEKKRLSLSTDIRKPPMLSSLRHPIYKAGLTNSFSFEDAVNQLML